MLNINTSKSNYIVSIFAIVVYFWLYIVMYWFGVKGIIPFEMSIHRILINLMVVFIVILILLDIYNNKKISYYDITFITFIIYIAAIVLSHHYLGEKLSDKSGVSVLKYTLYVIVQYLVCYFIGKYFLLVNSAQGLKITIFGHGICLFVLFNFMSSSSILIDVSDIEHSQKGIYLFTSEYIAFFSFMLVAACKERKTSIMATLLCALLIFCFLSRSALFLFLFSASVLMMRRYKYLTVFVILVVSLILYLNIDWLYENYPRMFFFLDYSNDVSFQGRELQKEIGYQRLIENLFMGDYGGQVITLGYVGEYIHNILSFWRQFGLIPFCLIIFLVFIYPIKLLYKNRNERLDYKTNLLLMMTVYVAFQVLFSRSFSWPYLFIFVGMVSAYATHKKHVNHGMGKGI